MVERKFYHVEGIGHVRRDAYRAHCKECGHYYELSGDAFGGFWHFAVKLTPAEADAFNAWIDEYDAASGTEAIAEVR